MFGIHKICNQLSYQVHNQFIDQRLEWSRAETESPWRNELHSLSACLPYTMMRQSALISSPLHPPAPSPSLSPCLSLSLPNIAGHSPVSASLACPDRPFWTDVSVSGPAALDHRSGAIIHLGMGEGSMERWGLPAISYSGEDSEVVSGSARVIVVKQSTAGGEERKGGGTVLLLKWKERYKGETRELVHSEAWTGRLEGWEGAELSWFWCCESWEKKWSTPSSRAMMWHGLVWRIVDSG